MREAATPTHATAHRASKAKRKEEKREEIVSLIVLTSILMTLMSLSSPKEGREKVKRKREEKEVVRERELERVAWGIASSYVASKLRRREHCCEPNETRQGTEKEEGKE